MGVAEGITEGVTEGVALGVAEGITVGTTVGITVGTTEGCTLTLTEGITPGATEGVAEGVTEGVAVGITEGVTEGVTVGATEGRTEGVTLGVTEGCTLTLTEGIALGVTEGAGSFFRLHPVRVNASASAVTVNNSFFILFSLFFPPCTAVGIWFRKASLFNEKSNQNKRLWQRILRGAKNSLYLLCVIRAGVCSVPRVVHFFYNA